MSWMLVWARTLCSNQRDCPKSIKGTTILVVFTPYFGQGGLTKHVGSLMHLNCVWVHVLQSKCLTVSPHAAVSESNTVYQCSADLFASWLFLTNQPAKDLEYNFNRIELVSVVYCILNISILSCQTSSFTVSFVQQVLYDYSENMQMLLSKRTLNMIVQCICQHFSTVFVCLCK